MNVPKAPQPPTLTWWERVLTAVFLITAMVTPSILMSFLDDRLKWVHGLDPLNPIKILVFSFIAVAGGGIMGFFIVGFLDFICFGITMAVLGRLNLDKYSNEAAWLLISIANTIVIFSSPLFASPSSEMTAYQSLARFSAAYSIPALMLWTWLRNLILYRRTRNALKSVGRH